MPNTVDPVSIRVEHSTTHGLSRRFHEIWGFWPMSGWLENSVTRGVEYHEGRWVA